MSNIIYMYAHNRNTHAHVSPPPGLAQTSAFMGDAKAAEDAARKIFSVEDRWVVRGEKGVKTIKCVSRRRSWLCLCAPVSERYQSLYTFWRYVLCINHGLSGKAKILSIDLKVSTPIKWRLENSLGHYRR